MGYLICQVIKDIVFFSETFPLVTLMYFAAVVIAF